MAMLRRGLTGEPVRILQRSLGLEPDGIFGKGTEAALIAYQKENGLSADGIAGPDTFTAMGLYELVLLHRPIRGELVKRVQEALGVSADGVFGQGTEAAVKKYQEENGLEPTGMVDPTMLAALQFAEWTPERVAASFVAEGVSVEVAPEALDAAKQAEPEPPPQASSFVSKVGSAVGDVAAVVAHPYATLGRSVWSGLKSLF